MCGGPPSQTVKYFNNYGHRYRSSSYQGRGQIANYQRRNISDDFMSSYRK